MDLKTIEKKRGRKPKYLTQIDRINGRRKTRTDSANRKRILKKPVIIEINNFDDRYRSSLYKWLINIDFVGMVTLTDKDNLTLKNHNSLVNKKLQNVFNKGYVTCFFKVVELKERRYHSHILVIPDKTLKSIVGLFKRYWEKEYGWVDFKRFKDEDHKNNETFYILKQLRPSDRRHSIQELIDSWSYGEPAKPTVEYNLFLDRAFLVSVWEDKNYTYKRPAGSLIIPNMALNEAFRRIQAKMDNQKEPQKTGGYL